MNLFRNFGRPRRLWRFIVVIGAAVLVALGRNWSGDVPEQVDGRAHVIDGDSLRVAGEEIRLAGIDAPERRQLCQLRGADWSCGKESERALRNLLGDHSVECDVEGVDKYDRLLAVCHVKSKEINAWMVERGWALSYGRYGSEERLASQERRGVWRGEFEDPKEWRARNLRGDLAAAAS